MSCLRCENGAKDDAGWGVNRNRHVGPSRLEKLLNLHVALVIGW